VVLDAGGSVFVYDKDGSLKGSWKANGLTTPAGIATDGTNIWIADSATRKILYYANGATRQSGAWDVTSSFKLASGNNKPTGLVERGGTLWVSDKTTSPGKVFVYSTAGSFQGSWTLDAKNVDPRGVTVNPSSGTDLWVVDHTQLRVYHYANATSRTSGSQAASDSFALAAADTDPEGIADPPASP
jgi:hypothetical protein